MRTNARFTHYGRLQLLRKQQLNRKPAPNHNTFIIKLEKGLNNEND